ncbi:hypothetical protein [Dyadobacter sp. 32]|uniref:hypothetical protein n=1 Tax=Dyadobacter sp. 32 TaxID=538966 RepID=UPI0011EC5EC3
MLINKTKYLSLLVLVGMGGCTTNQYISGSGAGYDDLYGGNSGPAQVERKNVDPDDSYARSNNPDYQQSYENTQGTADYYDESYLAASSVKRAVSSEVGYNAGFVDGYNQATRFSNPYNNFGYNGFGSFFPGSSMSFMFGMGRGFRMSPYMGFGMGSMLAYGYSPWGYGGMYDAFGYSPFGYDPFGYNSFYGGGFGMFNNYYGGYGYGGYGRPVIVVNNYERPGLTRSFGPRTATSGNARRADRYNNGFVNTPRSNVNSGNGRRSAESVDGSDYRSPRSNRSTGYSSGRVNAEASNASRSGRSYNAGDANNTYYARPRSNASNYSAAEGVRNYTAPRSSRSAGAYDASGTAPAYRAPARSQSNYNSAPSRSNSTYSSPSRSTESYRAPARSNNTYSAPTPSYSAPSRSYSAPSGGGSSGGGARSSSRGPR